MGQHVLHDPSVTVVRADVVEAWALHAYALQNLPGYTSSVRRAVLCWCADARVAYVEYLSVGWRLWRASEWIGPASDLGSPKPAPAGFELARRLRLYRVRERSMVLTVGGVDRIISFTGEDPPERGDVRRQVTMSWVQAIPNVGTVVDWTGTAVRRLRPGSTGPEAVAAALWWREKLSGAVAGAS